MNAMSEHALLVIEKRTNFHDIPNIQCMTIEK